MTPSNLPILGAAMKLDEFVAHRELMLELPRDLELQDFVAAEVLMGDWQSIAERARTVLDGHAGRLGIHGPFMGFKIDTVDPEVRQIVSRRFMQALDVCEAIGATQMVIHSPYTTWDHNNLDNVRGARERLIEACHASLREVVSRARDQGCTLVIESIEDKDPHARVTLARSFDSPAMAVSIDTGHSYYAHVSTGAPPVDHFVDAAGELLHHVHLQDADGFADRHWALGEGTIPWHPIFAALRRLGSTPRLIVELRDKQGLKASIAHLASLGLAR